MTSPSNLEAASAATEPARQEHDEADAPDQQMSLPAPAALPSCEPVAPAEPAEPPVVDSGTWIPQENNSPVEIPWKMLLTSNGAIVFEVTLRWTVAAAGLDVKQAQDFVRTRLSRERSSVPFSVMSQVARTPFLTGAFEWRDGQLWIIELAYPGAPARSSWIR